MKWALVLSGGGARGLAHIGVLEVLEEMGVPQPAMVVGCSMGAIIGGMYASGMTPADMRAYMETNKSPFFGGSRNTILRVGKGIKNLFLADGLDSGKTMYQILIELTKGASFAETRIPFYCNSTDLNTGHEIVPESGLIADAIRASASFPGVFSPYKKDGMLLVDGYLRHNPPVWIARDHGIKNVLAVYLDRFGRIKPGDMKSPLDILMRSFDCAIGTKLLTQKDIPTVRINAANDRATFDFDRPLEQIDFGHKIAMEQRETLDAFFAPGLKGMINRAQLARKEQKEHIHEHP